MQKMPRELYFVPLMRCKFVESLPEDHDWQYETKFDGYRAIALKQHGDAKLPMHLSVLKVPAGIIIAIRGKHSLLSYNAAASG